MALAVVTGRSEQTLDGKTVRGAGKQLNFSGYFRHLPISKVEAFFALSAFCLSLQQKDQLQDVRLVGSSSPR